MISFRDKAYCSDAEKCANKEGCSLWFSPAEDDAAMRWWGKEGAPVAFMSRKETCAKWEELK